MKGTKAQRARVTAYKLQSQGGNQVCQVPRSAEGAVMGGRGVRMPGMDIGLSLTWTPPRGRGRLRRVYGTDLENWN